MATTTANMGLKAWNSPGDFFSYTELANNWALIDAHNHTAGKGSLIPTAGIANLAVDNTKIANGAVNNGKIADGAVDAPKLANNAVATAKLQDGAVTSQKLAAVPHVRLGRATLLSVPVGSTWTAITWDIEKFDTFAMHDQVTNPTRITFGEAGLYLITGRIVWDQASATGTYRDAEIRRNGTDQLDWSRNGVSSLFITQPLHTLWRMAAGDYVEVRVRHDHTNSVALIGETSYGGSVRNPDFSAVKLSN